MPRRSRSRSRSRKKSARNRSPTESSPNRTLFIRNLSYNISRTDLQQCFERFGAVQDIHVPLDYFTGERRGFGYVTFYELIDARKAKFHTDGVPLLGKCMHVMYAATEPLNTWEMHAKYRRPRTEWNRSPAHTVDIEKFAALMTFLTSLFYLLTFEGFYFGRDFRTLKSFSPPRRIRRHSRSPLPKYRRNHRSPTPRSRSKTPPRREKESKKSDGYRLEKKHSKHKRRPRSPKTPPSPPPEPTVVDEEVNGIKRDYCANAENLPNRPPPMNTGGLTCHESVKVPKSVDSKEFQANDGDDRVVSREFD